jgi:demethylmenaquinone methyltransferase/2-methoxy-6-polyprenyl-1,4-benzoquinol methylase
VEDDELLAEQVAFYRARALRYDEWWQRRGPYARGPELDREFGRQVRVVEKALRNFAVGGDVLELAGGTGWWTERLAPSADHLTVVDSSLEALELNRARAGGPHVEYRVADIFDWSTEKRYDVVFFSFWLSHVPRRRFAAFWQMVRSHLRPAGRVFLIDNHEDPAPAEDVRDPYVRRYETDRHVRHLDDGREYNVVKVMYEPDELTAQLSDLGWTAELQATPWFLYGSARPR